ncbi:MAG TPA: hypothetical protein VFY93_04450 [Planctomycetota bacterium]|nr:hypothetical protein [Planctomycetota bacterium]
MPGQEPPKRLKFPCPQCGHGLGRHESGDARYSKKSLTLFGVGAILTAAWAGVLLAWSPVFLVPRSIGSFALCALFYLWPGLVVGAWASRLPRVRTRRCARCGWSETTTLGSAS